MQVVKRALAFARAGLSLTSGLTVNCPSAAIHSRFRLFRTAAFFAVLATACGCCLVLATILTAGCGILIVLHARLALFAAARHRFVSCTAGCFRALCVLPVTGAHLCILGVRGGHLAAAGTLFFFCALLLVGGCVLI